MVISNRNRSELEEGRKQIMLLNGVESLLKLLQQFLHNVIVHQYALGCLTLLVKNDKTVCEFIRRRLGLSLIVDSMGNFDSNPEYCVQVLPFLQEVITGRFEKNERELDAECYKVLINRMICEAVVTLLKKQIHLLTVVTMGLWFLDSLLGEGISSSEK